MTLLVAAAPQFATRGHAAEPGYGAWTSLLARYYDPAKGMDYRGLKAKDREAFNKLRSDIPLRCASAVRPLGARILTLYFFSLPNSCYVAQKCDRWPTRCYLSIR